MLVESHYLLSIPLPLEAGVVVVVVLFVVVVVVGMSSRLRRPVHEWSPRLCFDG